MFIDERKRKVALESLHWIPRRPYPKLQMAASQARSYILSGSVAAIVVLGSYFGAGLKTQHQVEQV